MALSDNQRALFHSPSPTDTIGFLQTRLDADELPTDLILALIAQVHAELAWRHSNKAADYANYARLVQSLRYHLPEIFQLLSKFWNERFDAQFDINQREPAETSSPDETFPELIDSETQIDDEPFSELGA